MTLLDSPLVDVGGCDRDCPRYAEINAMTPTVEKRRYLERDVRRCR